MECLYHIIAVLAIDSGFPMHSNCKIPHTSKKSIYGSLSISLVRAYTFINHFKQALYTTQTQTSKTNMPGNKRQWHQDRSGGYVSLCRSGSQGTMRPPIKRLAFNIIKIKRA
ncbi:hypothetical protein O0I10_012940 [Lichtheimia ornata]|uniref:Uncharacterized protein n=1 Tax=Lichtheimia ornata TaxID=688661 RepID=A0AAD7UR37_9FUNG|nr:uncharacterized protein O0I10_012940 [Lichtheimia ornata]KAJ8651496.1 hypothetical protein O0I10_012940 [Lichtheimia ornata]